MIDKKDKPIKDEKGIYPKITPEMDIFLKFWGFLEHRKLAQDSNLRDALKTIKDFIDEN